MKYITPHSSYSGCYLLHSYLICSLECESYEPVCFKAFGERSMEHLLSYREVKKRNKVTDTDARNFIVTYTVYMAHG